MATVFHITTRAAWEAARVAGRYAPPSFDDEGFIHCSEAHQVAGAAAAHFAGVPDLVVLAIAVDRLDVPLRHEFSLEGGGTFPHLYGTLDVGAVVEVLPLSAVAR